MPSSSAVPPEQAALLGTLPHDTLDDVELRHVQLSVANTRSLNEDDSSGVKQTVDTRHGPVVISVAGDLSKPIILTYHDLGLNHVTNFQAFMFYPEMRNLLSTFCVIHVNAPGQEAQAQSLPDGYVYPTVDELAETVSCVKSQLQLRSFIGFGIGLGANVLSRYAIKYPNEVDGLVLVNGSSTVAGWIEWGYQKLNIRHLKAGTMTTGSVDYLLWHHFGKVDECNHDLVTTYRQHFEKVLNATNLGLLIDSYIRRTDLGIVRELDPNKKKPFHIEGEGVLPNSEPLDYEKSHNHILSVMAYDCGMKRSQPVMVTVKVNRVCHLGWKGVPSQVEYSPGSGRQEVFPSASLELCKVPCVVERVRARITLTTNHIGKGCDRDTYSVPAQRKMCSD